MDLFYPSFAELGRSAIFSIEQVADRLPPGLIRFLVIVTQIRAAFRIRLGRLVGAAVWAAIGETGLVRFQFELFPADYAHLDRKGHDDSKLKRRSQFRITSKYIDAPTLMRDVDFKEYRR